MLGIGKDPSEQKGLHAAEKQQNMISVSALFSPNKF